MNLSPKHNELIDKREESLLRDPRNKGLAANYADIKNDITTNMEFAKELERNINSYTVLAKSIQGDERYSREFKTASGYLESKAGFTYDNNTKLHSEGHLRTDYNSTITNNAKEFRADERALLGHARDDEHEAALKNFFKDLKSAIELQVKAAIKTQREQETQK